MKTKMIDLIQVVSKILVIRGFVGFGGRGMARVWSAGTRVNSF